MLLNVENLNINFGKQTVFNNASFSINKNGFYCLMGRNGCGKSTLFKAILRLVDYTGSIEILEETKKDYVSYCMADPIVFDELTVLENLKLVTNDDEKIQELAKYFGIDTILNVRAKTCSAGEKQRICILRVILEDKAIILLDEATSHLDDANSTKILEYLKILSKDKVIIYSTHYEYEANQYADSFIRIDNFKISVTENTNTNINNIVNYKKDIYVNDNLLKKIVYWNGENIFALLIAILLGITTVFVWLSTITKYKAYEKYQSLANHQEYSEIRYINRFPSIAGSDFKYYMFLSDEIIEELKNSNNSYELSLEQYFVWLDNAFPDLYISIIYIDNDLEDYHIKLTNSAYTSLLNKGQVINNNKISLWETDLYVDEIISYDNDFNTEYLVINLKTYRRLFLNYMVKGKSGNSFKTIEACDFTLTYGRLPENSDEILLDEENLYYYVKIPLEIGGFRVEKRKKSYDEITTYEVEINNVKKTFKVVGYFENAFFKFDNRLCEDYLIKEEGYEFLLDSELEYYYKKGKSLYINANNLTLADVKFLLNNNLLLYNDVTIASYKTALYYESIQRINTICLVFIITIDILVWGFYFQLWKTNNIDKFYLLNILHVNKRIKQIFRKFKFLSLILTGIMTLIVYFFAQKATNIFVNKGAQEFVDIDMYKICDYTNHWVLIIVLVFLIAVEILIYTIQNRRYINDKY